MGLYKNKKLFVACSIALLFSLSSCASGVSSNTNASTSVTQAPPNNPNITNVSSTVDFNLELANSIIDKEVKDSDMDTSYDKSTSTLISLNGDSISFDGKGVTVNGTVATISSAGTYVLNGNLNNGQIIIDVPKTDNVKLVLENVNIHSETSASIYVRSADKLIITLPDGTQSTLSGGANYVDIDSNTIDGVIFSKDDLTINGNGTLNVNANYKHAIVSKNDLNIISGNYNIQSVSQALSGKDSVRIYGGTFNINSQGKGIKSENVDESEKGNIYIADGEININSVDDCLHTGGSIVIDGGTLNLSTEDDAIHADKDVVVNNGNINVGSSYEGIEGYKVVINGGDINIVSTDDGINAAAPNTTTSSSTTTTTPNEPNAGQTFAGRGGGIEQTDENAYIKITNGNIYINSGTDGIDSNGNILIKGGNLFISSSPMGADSFIDPNGVVKIEGGTVVATGAGGGRQQLNLESTQQVISYNVNPTSNDNKTLNIIDDSGNIIVSWTPSQTYSAVFITSPQLVLNGSYKLVTGTGTIDLVLQNTITTNVSSGTGKGGFGGGRGNRPSMDGSVTPPTAPPDVNNSLDVQSNTGINTINTNNSIVTEI